MLLGNADRVAAASASALSLPALLAALAPSATDVGAATWMRPATALGVLATSAALVLAGLQLRGRKLSATMQGARSLLASVPIAIAIERALGSSAEATSTWGRLPILAALALALLGLALLIDAWRRRSATTESASLVSGSSAARASRLGPRVLFHGACLIVLGQSWFSLVSLAVAWSSAPELDHSSHVLPAAVAALGVLALGCSSLRPDEGLFALLGDRGPAGKTTRWLLPLGAGLPLLLGWGMVWGYQVGVLDLPLGFALFSTSLSLGLIALRWLGSRDQHAFEVERGAAAARLQDAARAAERDRRRFQAIFDAMFQAIFVLSPDGKLLEANRTALGLWGSKGFIGQPLWLAPEWQGEPAAQLERAVSRAANGHFVRYTSVFDGHPEHSKSFDFSILPITDSSGSAQLLILEARDISEIEMARKALLESEDRFARSIQYSAIGFALVDLQGRWLRVNPMLCEILGRSEPELLAVTFQDITHPSDLQTDLELMQGLLAGESSHYHMEKRYLQKDGSPVWCLLSVSLVRSVDGDPRYFVSQVQDISQRKAAEAETQQSLREKEMLLREIHHRVKNNLQIVSSILRLARTKLTEPAHQELFDECQGRIRSMGLIHEQLYRAEALGRIDFAEHLRQLCQLARQMWGSASKVELALELEMVWLDLDTAVPLGLIANEVISNAFKHAFPGGRAGKVSIALQTHADLLSLTIRDNGVGLGKSFDLGRSNSLGMRIVTSLARQIRGEFELGGEGGVEFRLRVGANEPALERGAA